MKRSNLWGCKKAHLQRLFYYVILCMLARGVGKRV